MSIQEKQITAATAANAIDATHKHWFVDENGRPRLKDDAGVLTDFTGSTIYSDPGAPAGGLGKVGDFYLNETNSDYYLKTGVSTWTLQGNLQGIQGIQGVPGEVSQASFDAHLNDTTDAHDASAVSYAGGTGMSATDVEAAIDELATEKANAAVVLTAGAGLTGGGDLSASRTLDVANSDGTITVAADAISRPAITGDVSVPVASNVATIAANAVSDTQLRDSAGFSVIGKATTGTGDPADIVASTRNILRRLATGNLGFGTLSEHLGIFDVHDYGAVGDGDRLGAGTDDSAAIQAAINAAKVNGGIVFFHPLCYNLLTQLDMFDCSGVRLMGSGMYGNQDEMGTQGAQGTMLFWDAVASSSAMIRVGTTVNTNKVCKGAAITDMTLQVAGNNDYGILVQSCAWLLLNRLFILNPETAAISMQCLVTDSPPRDPMDNANCTLDTISIRCIDGAGTSAKGLEITGSSNANTSNCSFRNIRISHNDGIAIDVINADTNKFYDVTVNHADGITPAIGLKLGSGASEAVCCRGNMFYGLSVGAGGCVIDTANSFPPRDNMVWGYSVENGEPLATLTNQAGTTAVSDLIKIVTTGATSSGIGAAFDTMLGNTPAFRRSANLTTSATTITDVLTWPIGPSEVWQFEAHLNGTVSSSGGIKVAVNGPAAATIEATARGPLTASTTFQVSRLAVLNGDSPATFWATTGTPQVNVHVNGTIVNSTTAGTAAVRVRSITSGQTTTINTGSYLICRKVANQ